jgi:hypothetical protein
LDESIHIGEVPKHGTTRLVWSPAGPPNTTFSIQGVPLPAERPHDPPYRHDLHADRPTLLDAEAVFIYIRSLVLDGLLTLTDSVARITLIAVLHGLLTRVRCPVRCLPLCSCLVLDGLTSFSDSVSDV